MSSDFSRRSFIKIAVGSIAALPVVAGGFILPTERHGGEAQALEGTEGEVRIVAISPRQIGLYVCDQTDEGNVPIQGAEVTLTSRYNGKVRRDTTSDIGVVVFDIVDLAEEELNDSYYCFNGTIDVVCDGYREFHMGLARLTGGTPFEVPTRKLEPGVPYPSRVSLAEWDVLYSKNEFVSTEANDTDVDMLIELKNLTKPATLTLRERNSTKVYASTSLSPQGGTASASIHDMLLKSDTSNALPPEGDFFMQFETTDTIYEFPIALQVKKGVVKKFDIQPYQDLTPCNVNLPTTPQISIPDYIPIFGNQKFTPWLPQWSVIPVIDPFGFFYIAYTTPRVGYVRDNGSTNPKQWGVHPYASSKEQYSREIDKMAKSGSDALAAMSRGGLFKHASFTPNFSLALSLRLEAMAKWDYSTGQFSGDGGAALLVDASAGFTEQFAVGPVPVYIGVLFNLNVALGAMLGFATPDALDFSQYDWDYSNSGITLTINLSGSLSLGVGVSGVASVGGKGTLVALVFVGLSTLSPDLRLPMPHVKVGFSGQVAVEVQFLFFKWSGVLFSFNKPEFYNNWNENKLAGGAVEAAPEGSTTYRLGNGYSFAAKPGTRAAGNYLWTAIMNDATPVTTSDLAETSEIRLTSLLQGPAPVYEFGSPTEPAEGDEAGNFPWSDALIADTWEETPLRETSTGDELAGVEAVDRENGGIWPSLSKILIPNIFSDPRTKVIPYKEGEEEFGFMFRIASVEVDGEMRSRVVVQAVDRGSTTATRTIAFATGIDEIPRDDLFDYDFDVASNVDGTKISLFILSGTRPNPDEIDPYAAFETMVFTYVELAVSGASVLDGRDGISVVSTFSWQAVNFYNVRGKKNVFFCPRVTYLGEDYGDEKFMALSWLHRYTTDEGMPLDSADAKTTIGVAFPYASGVTLTRFEYTVGEVGDGTAYDLSVARGDFTDTSHFDMSFAVRGANGTSGVAAVMRASFGSGLPTVTSATVGPTHPINCHLTPWAGHTGFLASYENRLVQLELKNDDTMFHITQIGEGDVCVDSLGTDATGTFVYYAANKNGVAEYEVTDDETTPADPVEENFIVAHKLHKGSFSEPYTICRVRHSNEYLACIGHRGSALAFLSTAITDFNTSKADMWYTVVPSVCTPTLLSVAARNPVVAAGDYAHFLLTLRNDGNVYITGAKAQLYDEDGAYVSEGIVEFNETTLQASVWNPPAELNEYGYALVEPDPLLKSTVSGPHVEGTNTASTGLFNGMFKQASLRKAADKPRLLNTESDYELGPGKTSVYEVALKIPADWEGEHKVTLRLTNVAWVSSDAIASDARPLLLDDDDSQKLLQLTVSNEDGVDDSTQDAPITVIEKEPTEEQPGQQEQPQPSQQTQQPQGQKPQGTPNSGDESITTATAVALGALGAGMVAYSARRIAIENEDD